MLKKSNKQYKEPFRLTKAKLLAFGGLLFSFGLITSVATTYAWYSLTQFISITGLHLSISMDASLKLWLSKDKTKSLSELTEGVDLIHNEDGYSSEELGITEGFTLSDVSGMYKSLWQDDPSRNKDTLLPELYSFRGWNYETDRPVISDSNTYVQNVFYLEASADATIYLDGSIDEKDGKAKNTYIRPNEEANLKTANGDVNKAKELNEVVHTVRVSFLADDNYIIANPGESEDTSYAGTLDLNGDGYNDVKRNDQDEIVEKVYGEYSGNVEYGNPVEEEATPEGQRTTFNGKHMPGAKVAKQTYEAKKEGSVKLDTIMYDGNNPHQAKQALCEVKAHEKKRIVVTIYVEGWDLHMTDAINNASFNVSLSFLALFDK